MEQDKGKGAVAASSSSGYKKRRHANQCRSMLSFFKLSNSTSVSSQTQPHPAIALEETIEIVEGSCDVEENIHIADASKRRKWRNEWTKIHKWAFRVKTLSNEDRVKCSWCLEFKKDNTYTRDGSKVMQLSALNEHAKSEDHVYAAVAHHHKLKGENARGPMDVKIDVVRGTEKARIILCIQNVHWMAQCYFPLARFHDVCVHLRRIHAPNIPTSDEYGAYTNEMAAREFLMSIRNVFRSNLLDEVSSSPYFSILIDESTDRTLERHLIVYVQYLSENGKGKPKCDFIRLLPLEDGSAESCYNALQSLLISMDLKENKIVALATDGASTMPGCRTGMVTRFQVKNPDIKGIHCIAHREALAVKDALTSSPDIFYYVDKLANKVYSWLGKSSKRHEEFNDLLDTYDEHHLNTLQIHGVRWLSRGQVMVRLVCVMPAILDQWKLHDKKLYGMATIFQVQFIVHFLADVLVELNKLNSEFQKELLDVTKIGDMLDTVKVKLTRRYLTPERAFGDGTKHLSLFLSCCKYGFMSFLSDDGTTHEHELRYIPIPRKKDSLHELGLDDIPEDSGSLAHYIRIGKSFINVVLDSLARRFLDVSDIFEAMKFFNPSTYALGDVTRDDQTRDWLEKLLGKFSSKVDVARCLSEREDFVETLYRAAKNKGMTVAWSICREESGACDSWWDSFPALMRLWQCCMVIPGSTVSCERGFSRQNAIKSAIRSSMKLETLDATMMVSLCKEPFESVDWQACFDDWCEMKNRRAMPLE